MARTVLIISSADSADCQLFRHLSARVRSLVQNTVSGYYGDDLIRLGKSEEFDSMDTGFIVLGLSSASKRTGSAGFKVEHRLLKRAVAQSIPIGIVCDPNGGITAPHLVGGVLELVKVLLATRVEPACVPAEIYPNAHLIIDPARDNHIDFADKICEIVGPKKILPGEGLPKRQTQQAAAQSGWHNDQLTQ